MAENSTLEKFLDGRALHSGKFSKKTLLKRRALPTISGADMRAWKSFSIQNLNNRFATILRAACDDTAATENLVHLHYTHYNEGDGLIEEEYLARQYEEVLVPTLQRAMSKLKQQVEIASYTDDSCDEKCRDVPTLARRGEIGLYIGFKE